jgi:hypothetical protein
MDMSWRRSGCGSAVTTRRHCGPDRRGQPGVDIGGDHPEPRGGLTRGDTG